MLKRDQQGAPFDAREAQTERFSLSWCVYYVYVVCVAVKLFDTHLGNDTGSKPATMADPLLLISGLARCEAVLHGCETSSSGGRAGGRILYVLVTSKTTQGQVPTC